MLNNLPRTFQPVFGSQGNNDEFAVFGSMKSGTPVYSKTLKTLFESPAFLQGWQDAVAADKAPFLEEMNALFLTIYQQLAYGFQKGLPEWDPDTTYFANTSFCQVDGVWYQSVTDENIGNNPTEDEDETNWKKVSFSGGGSGGLGDTIPLFTGMYFDFKPNHLSWIEANTITKSGGIYEFAYNTLVSLLSNNTSELDIINVEDMVDGVNYDEYWKVDQTNMTFRTPLKISYKALDGGVKGNGNAISTTSANISVEAKGSWFLENAPGNRLAITESTTSGIGLNTDPTKSGIIAQESTAKLYFKVANAVSNLELLNAGEVLEELNNKIGLDSLDTLKPQIVSWGIPDYTAGVSAPKTNTIAEYDCYVKLNTGSNTTSTIYVNDNPVGSSWEGFVCAYVAKGDTFRVSGGNAGQVYPLKGANING